MEEQMKSLMAILQETSEKKAHTGGIKAVESPKSTDDSLVVGDNKWVSLGYIVKPAIISVKLRRVWKITKKQSTTT